MVELVKPVLQLVDLALQLHHEGVHVRLLQGGDVTDLDGTVLLNWFTLQKNLSCRPPRPLDRQRKDMERAGTTQARFPVLVRLLLCYPTTARWLPDSGPVLRGRGVGFSTIERTGHVEWISLVEGKTKEVPAQVAYADPARVARSKPACTPDLDSQLPLVRKELLRQPNTEITDVH